jgi:uncharacterized membrane protein (DUF485 family)
MKTYKNNKGVKMMSTGYLIAIGLFVFGFVMIALLGFLGTLEAIDYQNKIAKEKRLQQLGKGKQ